MKSLIVALGLVASVFAQSIDILTPTKNQVIINHLQDSLTSVVQIGIAITIARCEDNPCEDNPCEDKSQQLGEVLFAGPYNPTFVVPGFFGFYQNYSVATPITSGLAALSVVHPSLIGVNISSWFWPPQYLKPFCPHRMDLSLSLKWRMSPWSYSRERLMMTHWSSVRNGVHICLPLTV